MPMQYTAILTAVKLTIFSIIHSETCFLFLLKIDSGYTENKKKILSAPVHPKFTISNWCVRGSKLLKWHVLA